MPAASILDMARSMTRLAPFADLGRELLDLCEATMTAEHVHRRRLVMGLVDRILGALPGPTMLSFEDLQWADDVSLEVIAELARRSRDRQLLLIGDYRTEDVAPGASLRDWRARLITQRIAEEVRLGPLTEAETALVTTLILDTGLPAPRDVAAAVFERTDGIPLHIEELLGALSTEERADGTAIREATVPDTIEDAVDRPDRAALSPRPRPPPGPGPSSVAASSRRSSPGSWTYRRTRSRHRSRSSSTTSSSTRRDCAACTTSGTSCCATRSTARSRPRSVAGSTPGPRSSAPGSRERRRSTHRSTTNAPAVRRQAFEAAVAGAREAARLSAHREAFELYRRAVDNLPDDLDDEDRGALLDAYCR